MVVGTSLPVVETIVTDNVAQGLIPHNRVPKHLGHAKVEFRILSDICPFWKYRFILYASRDFVEQAIEPYVA